MVLSVETTLQHPRRGFIKLEDTVAVTETGHEVYGDRAHGWNRACRQSVAAVATIPLSSPKRIMGGLFKTALAGWWNDRAMSLGAAIAFFTVFSLAPMLLVAIAVAGLAFGREAAQGAIVAQLGGLAGGQTAAALQAMIASASNLGSGVIGIIIGVATFLFLATSAIIELQDDLNIIWKVKPPETYGIGAFVRI